MENISSQYLENVVSELSKLPGIGRRTALRLAIYLLKRNKVDVEFFCDTILKLKTEVKYCVYCNNISDGDVCPVCADSKRDSSLVCVVRDIKDVIAIESTMQFRGVYHVLGGIISPIDGIGPDDVAIGLLVERVKTGNVKELIMALPTSIEGETTAFYIYKLLNCYDLEFSQIARGLPIGDELEYADEVTLGRSITNRIPYKNK